MKVILSVVKELEQFRGVKRNNEVFIIPALKLPLFHYSIIPVQKISLFRYSETKAIIPLQKFPLLFLFHYSSSPPEAVAKKPLSLALGLVQTLKLTLKVTSKTSFPIPLLVTSAFERSTVPQNRTHVGYVDRIVSQSTGRGVTTIKKTFVS